MDEDKKPVDSGKNSAGNGTDDAACPEDSMPVLRRARTRTARVDDDLRPKRRVLYDRNQDDTDAGKSADGPFRVRIYDPADLHKAIHEIVGGNRPDFYEPETERPYDTEAHLANEETLRLKRLRVLASSPGGPWRSLLRGTPGMFERLEAVRRQAAHFAPFIDLVSRAIHVAIATNTPLRLPPILLIGEPGIGKTWVLKRVAEAIGNTFYMLPMNMTDAFRLRGLNSAWRGARPGKIAEAVLASPTASPIILLDELEKTPALDRMDRPFDVWHSLWERENSETFIDDYYEFPLRCDHVMWIASANSIDALPESILDRLLVMRIPSPSSDQVLAIIDGLYAASRTQLGSRLAEALSDEVRRAIARHTPRRAGRIIDIALGFMAAEGRYALAADDVDRAERMIESGSPRRHPVGFTPRCSSENSG